MQKFWYLHRLIAGSIILAVFLSAVLALLLALRSAQSTIDQSARRAVANAERLIDRIGLDLQKLDVLAQRPCDEATVAKLRDAVYGSTAQIREIGLINDATLYCTNFGPVSVSLDTIKQSLEVGTFISAGPNSVVANNSSLYVYTSLNRGRVINAVINPTAIAEFERTTLTNGRAHLMMSYSGPPASGTRVGDSDVLYEVGPAELKGSGASTLEGSYRSKRYPLFAQVTADRAIFWDEYWPTASHLLGVILPFFVVGAFVMDRLLASGVFSRVRYMQALKRGQFKVFYQPIVSARTRRLVGVEALLRWEHPKLGVMRAAQFAELFNDPVMDEPIARFVLETVCNDFKTAPIVAKHLWCSVNIAPALLERPSITSAIVGYSKQMARQQLRIEITERTPVSAAAEIAIREIRGHAIKVGLDDFGTGYSNINQLQTLAYDFIKLDGLLIRGIQSVDGLSPVLDSVIDLATKLNTEIVAEGVETIIQAQALSARNVRSLQGYLFSQAKPFGEVLTLVMQEHAFDLTQSSTLSGAG